MFEKGMIIQNRYEIIEEVGSGGMSIVYKAKCHVLNRYVAIKVLKPEFSDDKSFVNKFRIEAQSAAGLSHPNIVNVFDVGEENGFYYIVMELVEGITLKEYIQQNGRLPYQTALDFIIQICSGIEVAHEHHTIHRDIKPQNIIVSKNGTLKVTDFGIAKAATSNTIASSAMGSVHYISPEQARGGYADERSDIYSLGVTLYEMLTGRVPFEGENNVTVALMHIQSEVIPPREYYPDIPIGLEKVVLKMMQKKPERRYLTVNALLSDLKKLVMDPYADVANISNGQTLSSPTIQITEEELAAINKGASTGEGLSVFPVNHSELDEANKALESLYNDEDPDYYENYEKNEGEEDESIFDDNLTDDTESSTIDPKTEKMLTIAAITATVIIAIVIIVAIVSVTGVFKSNKTTQEASTEADVTMIDVLGWPEDKAIAALDEADIPYQVERDYSDKYEEGMVMSQSIEKGEKLKEDEKVTIVISKGMEEADVPNVVGKTVDNATSILKAAGFEVETREEYDEEVAENEVISQTPEGSKKAAKGSTITIVVSKGEEVKVATVPDLKNKTVTEAESALSQVKLKLGNVTQEYSDTVAEGQVIRQAIAYGTEVKEDTKIDITISKGAEPKTTTYSASFSGTLNNVSYAFEEGEVVYVTITLRSGGASYDIVKNYYTENSFPLSTAGLGTIDGLTSKDATLTYSVKDETGADITGNFSSSVQAKLREVVQ